MPRENKIKLVNDTQSEAKPETIAEEKGKLKIVNNTPFMAIVQLYKPDTNQPNNYTYIPPCSTRSLLNTYSDKWEVSFNNQNKQPIGDVSYKKGNTFNVVTSHLNQDQNTKLTCQYENLAKPVVAPPIRDETAKYMSEKFQMLLKSIAVNGVGEGAGTLQAEAAKMLETALSYLVEILPQNGDDWSNENIQKFIRLLGEAPRKQGDAVTQEEVKRVNEALKKHGWKAQIDSSKNLEELRIWTKLYDSFSKAVPSREVIAQNTRSLFDNQVKPMTKNVDKEIKNFIKLKGM